MTETIAEGLSVAGLVIGFPLLLLALMISLEKLESWGLREPTPPPDASSDVVDDAVEAIGQHAGLEAASEHDDAAAAHR